MNFSGTDTGASLHIKFLSDDVFLKCCARLEGETALVSLINQTFYLCELWVKTDRITPQMMKYRLTHLNDYWPTCDKNVLDFVWMNVEDLFQMPSKLFQHLRCFSFGPSRRPPWQMVPWLAPRCPCCVEACLYLSVWYVFWWMTLWDAGVCLRYERYLCWSFFFLFFHCMNYSVFVCLGIWQMFQASYMLCEDSWTPHCIKSLQQLSHLQYFFSKIISIAS